MRYDFEWDINKAKSNFLKHEISFERGTTIFRDPNALSIPDTEHSEAEERWITMGIDGNGILLIISHTFVDVSEDTIKIRMISARKAAQTEIKEYEEGI